MIHLYVSTHGVCVSVCPHTRAPTGASYVEQQRQSAAGSQPPAFASARAVGLPETLEQTGRLIGSLPNSHPTPPEMKPVQCLEIQEVTHQSEPPGGAAGQAGVGTWPPPRRSAAPGTQILWASSPPVYHPASPYSPVGSFSEGQLRVEQRDTVASPPGRPGEKADPPHQNCLSLPLRKRPSFRKDSDRTKG